MGNRVFNTRFPGYLYGRNRENLQKMLYCLGVEFRQLTMSHIRTESGALNVLTLDSFDRGSVMYV